MSDQIKDSGIRQTFETGAVRDGELYRGRFDLLPADVLLNMYQHQVYPYVAFEKLAIHFEAGAEKYSERNWEKGIPLTVYFNSAWRHNQKHVLGCTDEPHLLALTWNLICFLWTNDCIIDGLLPGTLWTFPFPLDEINYSRALSSGDVAYSLLQFLATGNNQHILDAAYHAMEEANES